MATTNIELDIENITGVSDADDQFVVGAQKFIVSSVPKDLLKWASTETVAGTHGGDSSPTAITVPIGSDNIVSVRRGSYLADQVAIQDSPYLSDSTSLKFATSKHPKYWLDPANKVQIKPAPSDSITAHVEYIDFSKLDDDSDLRNAIVFHACAKEFTKLSSDVIPDWSDVTVPIAPTSPDFGSDLSINAVAPSVPTITASTVDTSGWSAPSYIKPTITLTSNPSISDLSISSAEPVAPESPSFDSGAISISSSAPAYTKPTFSAPSLGSVGSLNLPVAPASPSLTTVSYTDATNADASASSIGAITVASVNKADISGNSPTYTKPSLTTRVSFDTFFDAATNSFGDNDPGAFSITSIAPSTPSISTVSYSDAGNADVTGTATIQAITVGSVNKPDISGDVPAYTKPSTSVTAAIPVAPTISTVSFTDPGLSILASEPSAVSLTTVNYSDANQTSVTSFNHPIFTAPTLDADVTFKTFYEDTSNANAFGDNDPGVFSISAVAPAPPADPVIAYSNASVGDGVAAAQDSINVAQSSITAGPTDASGTSDTDAPSDANNINTINYTKPTVGGTADELTDITALDSENTIDDFDGNSIEVDQWFATLAHLIEDEEDTELAQVQINKIRAYIDAFQAELQSASTNMQASIEKARLDTQVSIANASNDVSTNNASMQTQVQASIANASNDVQASISKMNNSTQAATTKMVQSTQAAVQKMQLSTNVNIQNAAKTMDALVQDYRSTIQKYEAQLSQYQADVQKEIATYSNKMAKYQLEVNINYTAWLEEQNDRLKKYQAELNANQIDYQRQEAIMQSDLQKALTDATEANKIALANNREEAKDAIENNNAAIAKYQAESQIYSSNIQKDIQSYSTEIEAASQSMQSTVQDNQIILAKYSNELKSFDSQVQKEIAVINADLQNELNEFNKENVRYQANIQAELAKHNSDLQKVMTQAQLDAQDAQQEAALATDVAKFNKAQDQVLDLGNKAKAMETLIADNNSIIQKYGAELNSYQSSIQSEVQEYSQKLARYQVEISTVTEAWAKTESDSLQQYQLDIQNELNEFNKDSTIYQANIQAELAKHNSDLQKVLTQAQIDAQDAQQEAALTTDVEKFNKAQDQALNLANTAKQIEDIIADNSSKIQKYQFDLQSYQIQVSSAIEKWTQEEWNQNFLKYQNDYGNLLQEFQVNVQNELNEFNKEQTVYQNELQEKIQEATNQQTKDAQEYSSKLQKYANELQSYQANVNKEIQEYTINEIQKELSIFNTNIQSDLQSYQAEIQNELNRFNKDSTIYQAQIQQSIQDAQLESAEESQKLQKYSAETAAYQQSIEKEVQNFVNTLSKEVQEYQSKLGLYTADLQKYQAEVASETQKTALNSQKAQLYESEANKYYQWAVAEIQAYVQNNSKMIGMQIAAQAAQK